MTGFDGSTYTYDAQNRMLTATKDGVTYTFTYDGLNRQVSRTVPEGTTYSAWDGWDLVEEYQGAGTIVAAYLYGASGLVKNLVTNNYYYQDGSGSTSHLADGSGALLEWYRYDLQGTPIFYNAANTQIPNSNYGIRHLFTGQQWYKEVGLYDLRNRFYSPDIGRFLQPDPIDFNGDATNLYRYCRNNPVNSLDPSGLWQVTIVGGHVYGGYITLGYNSGQWNFGGYVGAAEGLAVSFNPHDLGSHESGTNVGYISTGAVGAGIAHIGATGYGGGGGNSVTVTGRVGNVAGEFTLTKSGFSSEAASFVFGAAAFAGVGSNYYGQQNISPQPPTDYGDIVAYDANGNVIGTSPGVHVTAADPGDMVAYDANGNVIGTSPGVHVTATRDGSEGPSGSGGYMPSGLAGAGSPSQTELALYGGPFSVGWGTYEWQKNFWGIGK